MSSIRLQVLHKRCRLQTSFFFRDVHRKKKPYHSGLLTHGTLHSVACASCTLRCTALAATLNPESRLSIYHASMHIFSGAICSSRSNRWRCWEEIGIYWSGEVALNAAGCRRMIPVCTHTAVALWQHCTMIPSSTNAAGCWPLLTPRRVHLFVGKTEILVIFSVFGEYRDTNFGPENL